jgi:hypothetical protein
MAAGFPSTLNEFIDAALLGKVAPQPGLTLNIGREAIEDLTWCSSVLNIQALVSSLEIVPELRIVWPRQVWDHFASAPNTFPVLATALLHNRIRHVIVGEFEPPALAPIRSTLSKYRLLFDWFSAPQTLLCADHLGLGRPKDLYGQTSTPGIRPREDFEQLVFPFIERQLAIDLDEKKAFKWRAALASVIYELFENTDLHGKTDAQGKPLSPSIRGLVFREIPLQRYQPNPKLVPPRARCIEIGVFDTGVGYFERSRKSAITFNTELQLEWDVLHACLSTHLDDVVDSASDRGLHGIGLYEVLRALKFLSGAIEIRTGRLHGYRSFLPGDLPLQMESADSKDRPNMPKPTLLDYKQRYIKRPTQHSLVRGSAIRVLVPLL